MIASSVSLGSKVILQIPFATFSLTKWYAIELLFVHTVNSGLHVFLKPDMGSMCICACTLMGIPIICSYIA